MTLRSPLPRTDQSPLRSFAPGILEFKVDGIGRVLTHGGSWAGFETLFELAPDQRVAVAATCTSSTAARTLSDFVVLSLWAGTSTTSP